MPSYHKFIYIIQTVEHSLKQLTALMRHFILPFNLTHSEQLIEENWLTYVPSALTLATILLPMSLSVYYHIMHVYMDVAKFDYVHTNIAIYRNYYVSRQILHYEVNRYNNTEF